MVNMTLSIPEELHQIIKKYTEIRWSEVARQAMWTQARKLDLMDTISNALSSKGIDKTGPFVSISIFRRTVKR